MPYIYSVYEGDDTFTPTTQSFAENHPHGGFALTTHQGTQVSKWHVLDRNAPEEKYDPDTESRVDSLGQEIRPRDFAMTTMGTGHELSPCEVLGFTPKKVRVMIFGNWETTLKNPSDLVRIDKALFF